MCTYVSDMGMLFGYLVECRSHVSRTVKLLDIYAERHFSF